MLSDFDSSFRCNKFKDYICKNSDLNTKNAETTNYICMPNLKTIKTFLVCFHVLTKSIMKLISESLEEL